MNKLTIPVEISARHIHLSPEDFITLCGEGAKMEVVKELSQPGQFLSNIRLEIIGPKRSIANVSVLGPARGQTQVEVSATDARTLGAVAPIRESGNVSGSGAIKIKGPVGEIELTEGLIVAKRHVHMTPKDAENFNVKNGQIIRILIQEPERETIFGDVVVRVRDTFGLAVHIDTDEGNAANVGRDTVCTIFE